MPVAYSRYSWFLSAMEDEEITEQKWLSFSSLLNDLLVEISNKERINSCKEDFNNGLKTSNTKFEPCDELRNNKVFIGFLSFIIDFL